MIKMLYEYSTEYTTKHCATCYDEDINCIGETWLSLNLSIVVRFHGLMVTVVASQFKGREFESLCGQEEFFIS